MEEDEEACDKDLGKTGIRKNEVYVTKIVSQFQAFTVFTLQSSQLVHLVTNNLAVDDVVQCLQTRCREIHISEIYRDNCRCILKRYQANTDSPCIGEFDEGINGQKQTAALIKAVCGPSIILKLLWKLKVK